MSLQQKYLPGGKQNKYYLERAGVWWENYGKFQYPDCTSILILANGGGSNSSRHYIFKEDLQKLVNEIGKGKGLGFNVNAPLPLGIDDKAYLTYAEIISGLMHFNKPILATGGGGYDVEKTARGWALAWEIFCCEERDKADSSLGMGGSMLQSNEWSGGLRNRMLPIPEKKRWSLDTAIQATIDAVIKNVFRYHGIGV